MTTPDPIRAALERLITMAGDELNTPGLWAHSRATWGAALAAARAALEAPPMPPRHFARLTRTVNPDDTHTLYAIDQDGRAWWLILGHDEAPEGWTELQPLPSREDRP